MKSRIIFLILIFINLFYLDIYAQKPEHSKTVADLIEEIASQSDQELDYTQLAEDLQLFLENPLNINTLTREDLERLQFLNEFQIEDLLSVQRQPIPMLSIYELALLPSFSKVDINRLLPFVTVKEKAKKKAPFSVRNALKYGHHSLFLRTQFYLEKEKGYTPPEKEGDTRYLGNKMKYYTRYSFNYKQKVLFGFVGEKDEGEEFFTGTQKRGFDHMSMHLEVRDIGIIKNLALGDYTVRMGQGLAIGNGLFSGKNPYVLALKQNVTGIRKFSSTAENTFFRGVGTTLKWRDWSVTAFGSYKNIDGNLTDTDTLQNEADVISSFQNTGYHRTQSEIDDRKKVSEFVAGGSVRWHGKNIKVGANYIQYQYGANLERPFSVYRQYEFSGKKGANLSLDYEASIKNIYLFGEFATNSDKSYAMLNGLTARIAPGAGIALLHRNYARDYWALYSGAFGEQSRVQNERGLYLGAEFTPIRNWKLSVYYDMYKFPWLSFKKNAPTQGQDYFAQLDFTPGNNIQMYWRFKHETRPENGSKDNQTGVTSLFKTDLTKTSYNLSYRISDQLTLKNRVELAFYDKATQKHEMGVLLYQDVAWRSKTMPFSANFRIAYFDADYYARLYAYENDVLYAFSVPAYSGQGFRSYVTIKYTIVKNFIDIWLRYAITHYTDRNKIGSGLTEVDGENKSQLKLQLRIRL